MYTVSKRSGIHTIELNTRSQSPEVRTFEMLSMRVACAIGIKASIEAAGFKRIPVAVDEESIMMMTRKIFEIQR